MHRVGAPLALLVTLALAFSLAFTAGNAANSAPAGHPAARKVAQSPTGEMTSHIVGVAGHRKDTGSFTPLKFTKANGHLKARGLLQGVIHNKNGTTRTFSVLRTMRVQSIDGTRPGARATTSGRASCKILHLVLAPLDLNLLGLKVHLDRVVLDITAVSGPGNLLGNLLCAVAHLLDGTGTLGQLLSKLNAILDSLLMGL
ncbi:MAG: hypothetical protein ACR2K3_07755 [Nocardioides sp.]